MFIYILDFYVYADDRVVCSKYYSVRNYFNYSRWTNLTVLFFFWILNEI